MIPLSYVESYEDKIEIIGKPLIEPGNNDGIKKDSDGGRKMKIATISKIKNEADIIESFVRYHAEIVDAMFFVENGSTDGTVSILRLLKEEGYPITVFDESEQEFDELRFINQYASLVLKSNQIDWLIPLDADEFLDAGGENPRTYMEKWDTDFVYTVMWKTYVWNEDVEKKSGFVPDRFEAYRDEKYEIFKKVVIPGQLYEKKKLLIMHGNHDVIGIDLKKKSDSSIKFLHYPIRSREQFKAQTVVNTIMEMSRSSRREGEAWHWDNAYRTIKENRELDLERISQTYAMSVKEKADNPKVYVHSGRMNYSFISGIEMKYEQYAEVSAFDNLMCFSEKLAGKYAKGNWDKQNHGCNEKEKVVIYGTGYVSDFLSDIINTDLFTIMAYVKTDVEGDSRTFRGKELLKVDNISNLEFDCVVIASSRYYKEMKEKLLSLGVTKKIYFMTDILKKSWLLVN